MLQSNRTAKAVEVCRYLRSGEKDYKAIAEIVGCDLSTVYNYRAKIFPELKRKRRPRNAKKPLVKAQFSRDNNTVTFVPSEKTTEDFIKEMSQATDVFFEDAMVNHPAHYTAGGIETYDFIVAKKLSYELGNVVKYVTRADYKGNKLQDLKKAQWYLAAAIKQEEQSNG